MRFLLPLLLALPVCALANPESDFRAAREALRVGNLARLDKAVENLQDTPLEIYATNFQLRARLSTRPTEAIRVFLARNDESPAVDQFRGDWLKFLGKDESWDAFAEEYPHLINIDDELACYGLQLHRQSDELAALEEARKLWFRDDEMPESCTPLFERARKLGIIAYADVWKRMRLVLEAGNVSFAKQLIKQLRKSEQFPAAELSVASSNPRRYLEKTKFEDAGTGRRLTALFALLRLSRQSPEIAFARWEKIANLYARVLAGTSAVDRAVRELEATRQSGVDPAANLQVVDPILAQGPRDIDALLLRARLCLDLDKPDEAAASYRRALDADPRRSAALRPEIEAAYTRTSHSALGQILVAVLTELDAPREATATLQQLHDARQLPVAAPYALSLGIASRFGLSAELLAVFLEAAVELGHADEARAAVAYYHAAPGTRVQDFAQLYSTHITI